MAASWPIKYVDSAKSGGKRKHSISNVETSAKKLKYEDNRVRSFKENWKAGGRG